jgi:Protein of unknown function (DUF4197)
MTPMRSIHSLATAATLLLVLLLPGCAAMQDGTLSGILDSLEKPRGLDEQTVTAGLKEALKVGTTRTVSATSAEGGYLGNALIRIALPEQLNSAASTLRDAGLGQYMDELEVGMNRAAELAAVEAADVFWNAITQMSVADAFSILNGNGTAATDYFRGKTSATLEQRFQPIVTGAMSEVGVANLYTRTLDIYNRIPLVEKPQIVNIEDYVTDRALFGLFTVLGQEEQKIRSDPIARTTDLLRRVFGQQGS